MVYKNESTQELDKLNVIKNMEIILVRHGKPIIPSLKKINALSFKSWVEQYNSAVLDITSKPSQALITLSENCNAVVCSQLIRSTQSAETLGIKNITLSDSHFNEAGLPNAPWRLLTFSPAFWVVFFRILWFFGYSHNTESFTEAKIRAKDSVQKLISLANEHHSVLFVGHGIYNKLLSKELRSLGWSGPRNPGSKHWSFGVYTLNNK